MEGERERELLDLIERYWRIRGRTIWRDKPGRIETTDPYENDLGIFHASWAESEACLREVGGEFAVRGVDFITTPWHRIVGVGPSPERWGIELMALDGSETVQGVDPVRSVALLKAFIGVFGK